MFTLLHQDKNTEARLGKLETAHGSIDTPVFMPVGTQATVKTLAPGELEAIGVTILLSNAYHLFVRPGIDIIEEGGGLHRFMGWNGPILTDSGGYQIFSLAKLRKVTEEGVLFNAHFDGGQHFLTPERVIDIQFALGSDIIMPLDECLHYPCERERVAQSVTLTTDWARRSKRQFIVDSLELRDKRKNTSRDKKLNPKLSTLNSQLLFGIVQGSIYPDLRKESFGRLAEIGFDGYAIGGLSVGEPDMLTTQTIKDTCLLLPSEKPRYLMGIGTPPEIVEAVSFGVDLFDSSVPTRYGRNGTAFTKAGKLVVRNAIAARDQRPIDEHCECLCCQKFTRSYIHHLINTGEILGLRLLSLHNIFFYIRLMKEIREAIVEDRFDEFKKNFLNSYKQKELNSKHEARNSKLFRPKTKDKRPFQYVSKENFACPPKLQRRRGSSVCGL